METYLESTGRILNGALAGMIGGAVASWVMNQYLAAQQQQSEAEQRPETATPRGQTAAPRPQVGDGSGLVDDATVKTAQVISTRVFDHELTPSEKKIAGAAVHYAFGTLAGGLYGAAAELTPLVTPGLGCCMAWGSGAWATPSRFRPCGLDRRPRRSRRRHADFLAAHLVYGLALDITRRMARHLG